MKGSDFSYDYVDLFYYKCQKNKFETTCCIIDIFSQLDKTEKKPAIDPEINDNKCF